HGLELRTRALECGTTRQSAEHEHRRTVARRERGLAQRQPRLLEAREAESLRHDSDYGRSCFAELYGLSDDARVAAELVVPELVADGDDVGRARGRIRVDEHTSAQRRHACERETARRHLRYRDRPRWTAGEDEVAIHRARGSQLFDTL